MICKTCVHRKIGDYAWCRMHTQERAENEIGLLAIVQCTGYVEAQQETQTPPPTIDEKQQPAKLSV